LIVLVELRFSPLPSKSWKATPKWQSIIDVGTQGTRKVVLIELPGIALQGPETIKQIN